ncbi:MAG: C1 family peptidase [Anaerolineae bacterium]|nr:C1 family peptidase [Anaerolineae bacterium]
MMPLIKRVATLLIVCLIIVGFSSVAEEKDSSVDLQQRPPGQYGLGCIPTRPGLYPLIPPALSSARLPLSVDLREGLPPAGDQRGQNSCVGWAVAYGYKTLQEVQEHQWDPVDPDHQFSPSYVYNQRPTSNCLRDNGMSIPSAMDILVEQGCVPISVFPYADDDTCTQPDESQRAVAAEYKVSSFAALFVGQGTANIQDLKAYLAGGNVFVLAFPAYASFFGPSCEEFLVGEPGLEETYYGGHAVLVMGYDDTIGGFSIFNSYGPGWKCDGYAYLSYAFVQHYAWEAWSMQDITNSEPLTATPEATPTLITTATAIPPSRETLEPTVTYTPELTATVERDHTPTNTPPLTTTPTDTPFPGVTPTATVVSAETPTPTPSPDPLPRPWHERVCPGGFLMPMVIVGVGIAGRWTRRKGHA